MAHIDQATLLVSCPEDDVDRITSGLTELIKDKRLRDGCIRFNITRFQSGRIEFQIRYSTKKAHRTIGRLLRRSKAKEKVNVSNIQTV